MLRRNRNLALVVFARFISRFGGAAVWFIGVWGTAAYVFGATPSQLAAMSFGNGMAAIVGSLSAGVLIDRFGPRKVMIWSEVFSIPPLIAMLFVDSFVPFVACAMLYTLFGVPTWTAGASFAPYIVEGAKPLERANSYIEGGAALGFVLGPAVAAVLSDNVGLTSVFVLTAVACAAAGVAVWFTRIDETPRAHVSGNAWAEFTSGLRLAYTSRSIRFYIFMGTAVWFGFGAFSALEPLFYRDVVGVDVEWIGWMNTALGVGLISGAALLPRLSQKVISARGLASFATLCGLGTAMYVASTDLRLIAVGAFMLGAFLGATEPLLRTLLHLDSPHEYVGRIVGTTQWHRSAGELVPLAFVPMLAATIGIQETLIGSGLVVAVIALVGVAFSARIDRHRAAVAVTLAAASAVAPADAAPEVA